MNQIVKAEGNALATQDNGIGIEGLEDLPASIIPVPWLKLVQPTSRGVETVDGSDAPVGYFFYSDTQEALQEIEFAMLKAKQGTAEFEVNGEKKVTQRLAILGYDLQNNRKFVLMLAVTSFASFGSLVAKLKQAGVTNTYSQRIIISSEKTENDKGKYFVAKFELGEKLPEEKIAEFAEMKKAYEVVLNRQAPEDLKAEVVAEPEPTPTEDPNPVVVDESVKDEDLPF